MSDCSGDTTGVVRFRCNLERYYTFSNSSVSETRRRIALARQKAVVLASIWKNRNIKTATKVKVMKSMVWALGSIPVWSGGMDFEEIGQE